MLSRHGACAFTAMPPQLHRLVGVYKCALHAYALLSVLAGARSSCRRAAPMGGADLTLLLEPRLEPRIGARRLRSQRACARAQLPDCTRLFSSRARSRLSLRLACRSISL
eukprot:2656058-Pleurochrysis_carterae.AAC.2